MALSVIPYAVGQVASGVNLTGAVQDPSGANLTGVVVTLRPAATTAGTEQGITDATGHFHFVGVARGQYQIEVSPPGFAPATQAVSVGVKPIANLRIMLKLAAASQRVTVNAAAATVDTDPANNRDSISLSQDTLKNLPVFDQNYIATVSRFLDSGDLGSGGATLVVDGVEAKGVPVSASAIQSVKISSDPYSAAFSRPGRGRIEIFTKPGEAHYHGEFNFTFRDSGLNARNAFALSRPAEQRRIFEGNVTGPVGTSKVNTFVISGHRAARDTQAIVFALGPGGAIHQNLPTPSRDTLVSASLDHHASQNNEISLRYSYHRSSDLNGGVGGFTLPEAAANSTDVEEQLWYHQRTLLTPNLLNQFQLRLGQESQPTVGVNAATQIVVQGAFTGGGAQIKELETEHHITGSESLSWSHGRQAIMAGVDLPDWSNHRFDNFDNFGGTFFFNNLQDYANQKPYLYTQQQGNGHAVFLYKAFGFYVQDQIQARPDLTLTMGLRHDWENFFPDNDNLAPRLSLAYAPGKSRKTVVRLGAGIFYDRLHDHQVADLIHYDGTGLQSYILTNPSYPNPLAGGQTLSAQPTMLEKLAPGVKMPYTIQFSAGVERQLGKATLAVSYTGSQRVDQFRSQDINAPLPPLYQARPDPSVGQLRQIQTAGRAEGNSIRFSLRGRLTRKLSGMTQYTYGRSYDNTDGLGSFPANPLSFAGEWGRARYDQRQRLDVEESYSAPGGFDLGVALALYSGRPYTETLGRDIYNDGMSNARPVGVPRNSLQAPGYSDLDLDLSRDFALHRLMPWGGKDAAPMLNLSVSAFNALNRVNFNSPVGNLQSPFFGRPVSADSPRQLQLAARFEF